METVRKWIPGSKWLYLKIYTGVKTSDVILEEAIQPLTDFFLENNYITKWFFIRYNDPKSHLRVRFELSDCNHYSEVLSRIQSSFEKYISSGEISNFGIDVYSRELERYGRENIEDAEVLFYKSSDFLLKNCLNLSDEEKIIASMYYIERILDLLNLSMDEKMNWIKNSNDSFKKEFSADKKLNSQLDKKYRAFKPKYIEFLQSEDFVDFKNEIDSSTFDILPILKSVVLKNTFVESFFASIFHMHINRMFISNQRIFEMIIYDYMHRYYKTLFFKQILNNSNFFD